MNTYTIKFTEEPINIDGNPSKDVWNLTESLKLLNYMGSYPLYFPIVDVKLRYDRKNIYVLFKVLDKNIISVSEKHFDPVFEDSCVEFFFAPDSENPNAYFNLEVNCSGKVLFGYRNHKSQKSIRISLDEIEQLNVKTTFYGKLITEEIKEETEWYAEYKIPIEILEKYMGKKINENCREWNVNFYKCADKCSTPHWLTWNKVEYDSPNYHLPEYFGKIIF